MSEQHGWPRGRRSGIAAGSPRPVMVCACAGCTRWCRSCPHSPCQGIDTHCQPCSHKASSSARLVIASSNSRSRSRHFLSPSVVRKSVHPRRMLPTGGSRGWRWSCLRGRRARRAGRPPAGRRSSRRALCSRRTARGRWPGRWWRGHVLRKYARPTGVGERSVAGNCFQVFVLWNIAPACTRQWGPSTCPRRRRASSIMGNVVPTSSQKIARAVPGRPRRRRRGGVVPSSSVGLFGARSGTRRTAQPGTELEPGVNVPGAPGGSGKSDHRDDGATALPDRCVVPRWNRVHRQVRRWGCAHNRRCRGLSSGARQVAPARSINCSRSAPRSCVRYCVALGSPRGCPRGHPEKAHGP